MTFVAKTLAVSGERSALSGLLHRQRKERRRVEISGYLVRLDKTIVDVKLTDLSYDGCALTTDTPLVPGEKVKLSALGRGATAAAVRWYEGRTAGLHFQSEPVSRQRWPRKAERHPISAQASLRRLQRPVYRVTMSDITPFGCKTEFIERPVIYEHVWIKFDGLASLEAIVCWIEQSSMGLMYLNPIHPAVFAMLLEWMNPLPVAKIGGQQKDCRSNL